MNSDKRQYINKFGSLYRRYLNPNNSSGHQGNVSGIFAVRMFVIIDSYYYNDRHVDSSYRVGLNIGQFKSAVSTRGLIDQTVYLKDSLILIDKLHLLLTGKVEAIEHRTKEEKYIDNNVKAEVIVKFGVVKRGDNTYSLGIIHSPPHNVDDEHYAYFKMTLDRYDLLELYQLLKNFPNISYNMISSLAANQFQTDAINTTFQPVTQNVYPEQRSIPTEIPVQIESNVDYSEINTLETSEFGLNIPSMTSIEMKVNKETIDEIIESNVDTVSDEPLDHTNESEDISLDDLKSEIEDELTDDEEDNEQLQQHLEEQKKIYEEERKRAEEERLKNQESEEVVQETIVETKIDEPVKDDPTEIKELETKIPYEDLANEPLPWDVVEEPKKEINSIEQSITTEPKEELKYPKRYIDLGIDKIIEVYNLDYKIIDDVLKLELNDRLKSDFANIIIDTINKVGAIGINSTPVKLKQQFLLANFNLKEFLELHPQFNNSKGFLILLQTLNVTIRTMRDDVMFGEDLTDDIITERISDLVNKHYEIYSNENKYVEYIKENIH